VRSDREFVELRLQILKLRMVEDAGHVRCDLEGIGQSYVDTNDHSPGA
jgi:hypothetical protein